MSAALLFAVMISLAAAQGDKLFDDLDAVLKEASKKESPAALVPGHTQAGVFLQLWQHSRLELTGRYAHYTRNIHYTDRDEGELSLGFNTWTGKEWWRLHASGWLEAGTQDDTYRGLSASLRDECRRRRYLELNEIYTTISRGNLDVTLGKRIMPRDTTLEYQPSHVYHPLDLNVPVEPRTLGLWQLATDCAFGDTRLILAWLPVFQDPKTPSIHSRWMPFHNALAEARSEAWSREEAVWIRDKFSLQHAFDHPKSIFLYYYWRVFGEDSALRKMLEVRNDLPGAALNEFGYLAKLKTSVGFLDLYGSYFFGPSEFPVVKVEARPQTIAFIKQNPSVHKLGGGAGTAWRDFTLRADGVFSLSPEGRDDSFVRYVAGVGYTAPWLASAFGMERVDLLVDYAGEKITERQRAPGYFFSSEIIRPFRHDILVRLLLGLTADLRVQYAADFDLGGNSLQRNGLGGDVHGYRVSGSAQYHHLRISYRIRSGLVSEVYYERFDGGLDSYIGQWKDNDRVVVLLRWTL